jgi:predicted small integral membrane protein
VQSGGAFFNFFNIDGMRSWVVATVGFACLKVNIGVIPFGQTEARTELFVGIIGSGFIELVLVFHALKLAMFKQLSNSQDVELFQKNGLTQYELDQFDGFLA